LYWNDLTEEEKLNVNKVMEALKNPKIGGMYEKGDGYFHLEKNTKKSILFLKKKYNFANIYYNDFESDVNNLLTLGAVWSMRWFSKVAGVAHGWEKAPTQKITR
jgi:hypothetical protein